MSEKTIDKKHVTDRIKFIARFYNEEDINIYYEAHEDELESLIKAGFALAQCVGLEHSMVDKGIVTSKAVSFLLATDQDCAKCLCITLCLEKIIEDNTEKARVY